MKEKDIKDENVDNQALEQDESFDVTPEEEAAEQCAADKMAGATDSEAEIWKDKYTRLVAEFDNFRRRTSREKMELVEAGGEEIVRAMLEVLDDMDRALAAIETATDMEAVRQGMVLIDNKLRGALKARGLTEIEAVGGELDTDLHEAVARIEAAEEAQKGKILDVVQKGYKLRERVIRYAKVVVGQ